MDLTKLKAFLARENQRFICHDTGWPEPGPDRFVAYIEHRSTPPVDEVTLKSIKEHYGNLDQLVEFYSEIGSLRLYCDTNSVESAFYIAQPGEWAQLAGMLNSWLESLNEEEARELIPEWIPDSIVFGEIPESGNYLIMPCTGEDTGKIFEFEHDGFEFLEEAKDLSSFIDKVISPTDKLIRRIRSHTRYSDMETDIQWLAEKYEYGKGNL